LHGLGHGQEEIPWSTEHTNEKVPDLNTAVEQMEGALKEGYIGGPLHLKNEKLAI
jgi:hypothetical protein